MKTNSTRLVNTNNLRSEDILPLNHDFFQQLLNVFECLFTSQTHVVSLR